MLSQVRARTLVLGLNVHPALCDGKQLAPVAPSPRYSSTTTLSSVRVVRRELSTRSSVPPCSSIATTGRSANGMADCAIADAVAGE